MLLSHAPLLSVLDALLVGPSERRLPSSCSGPLAPQRTLGRQGSVRDTPVPEPVNPTLPLTECTHELQKMFPNLGRQTGSSVYCSSRRWSGAALASSFICAVLAVSTTGCGHFNDLAGSYAHTGERALVGVRHASTLALTLCQANATQAYLQMRLGLGSKGDVSSPPSWGTWYRTEPAEGTASSAWSAYCNELDATGIVFDDAVVVLGVYGEAIGPCRGEGLRRIRPRSSCHWCRHGHCGPRRQQWRCIDGEEHWLAPLFHCDVRGRPDSTAEA